MELKFIVFGTYTISKLSKLYAGIINNRAKYERMLANETIREK